MPTDTELKFQEAAIQFRLASANASDPAVFRSCVNAFIAHARSVTFIMQAESGSVPGLLDWYRQESQRLRSDPLCRFFNDLRVYTIHRGTVVPASESLPVRAVYAQPTGRSALPLKTFRVVTPSEKITRIRGDVVFSNGSGTLVFWSFLGIERFIPGDSGGVFRLCQQYLTTLRTFVREWLQRRSALGAA